MRASGQISIRAAGHDSGRFGAFAGAFAILNLAMFHVKQDETMTLVGGGPRPRESGSG
jgi:hypothetical protein